MRDGSRRVSVREIATVGDPVLRERAREVTPDELRSAEVQALIDDLIETMRAANGAGLAANQSASRCGSRSSRSSGGNPRYPYKPPIPLTVIVNPVIEPLDDEVVEINEGCLSVPDLRGEVTRHVDVAAALPRPRRRRARRGQARAHRRAPSSTRSTTSTACCSSTASDPRTFTTWEQFERYHRDAFVERITRARRAGRLVTRLLVRARLARRRRGRGRRAGRGRGRADRRGRAGRERAAGGRRAARRAHAARACQRALARLPPRAARAHAGRAAARSGPGASRCTRSRRRSTPTATCALARATFAEMALAGITAVGEFHYLHHGPAARRTPTRTRWARR